MYLTLLKPTLLGSVYFSVDGGSVNLNHWAANGELVFDVKVNSKADDTVLLVKIDSDWPNVSDMTVEVAPNGEWKTVRIGVADLIGNGNSLACCGNAADLSAITNIFVIEPLGAMNVSFDNIRFVVE